MKHTLQAISRWLVVVMAFAIPVSTALDNILMGLIFLTGAAGNGGAVLRVVRRNAPARAGVLLFLLLAAGLSWGAAPLQTAVGILGKYADLALMPFMLVILRDEVTRRRAMQVFMVVMILTALLSWLVGLSLLPVTSWMWEGCRPDNPAIFRGSITQNVLMAYAVYLALLQAREVAILSRRWWMLVVAAAVMGGDVLLMVQGRTGYIVLLVLLAVLAWHVLHAWMRARGHRVGGGILALALVLAGASLTGIYYAVPRLHDRVDQAAAELRAWKPGVHTDSSIGERMEFYNTTAGLIAHRPLAGYGTGGFEGAYGELARSKGLPGARNPHNEYLLITAQLGLLGLAALLYLFYTQWRSALGLPAPYAQHAARGLVLTLAITSLFNSPLLDHTEGIFYAFMSAFWFARLEAGRGHA